MSSPTKTLRSVSGSFAFLLAAAGIAYAGGHTWRVNEVFSNAAGNIQFVELREVGGGANETGIVGRTVTSTTRSFTIPGPAPSAPTSNKTLLFATPDFAALPGVPTPNYIFPAGSVPFISPGGSDSVSYNPYDPGGIAYATGVLPTDGVKSLNDGNIIACNTPKNYAGVTATLNLGCSTLGDVDDSAVLDGGDIAGFVRSKLGVPDVDDNPACAEYCTGSLAADINAFVNDLLN
ncbi:MAG TPA: hypothetical protein VNT79_11125 [Phycisphaerae bacterium]|nr:hypothetical protein [Phycisphaerae bacterium]